MAFFLGILCISTTVCIVVFMMLFFDYKARQMDNNKEYFQEEEKTKRAALEVERLKQENENYRLRHSIN